MKIGVKKVITNFWNREQVEPKPMSPPKIHFSGYKNTNDNLTKSRLIDFFTDFWGTFCCHSSESSTSWPGRWSDLGLALLSRLVNRTETIRRKKIRKYFILKKRHWRFVCLINCLLTMPKDKWSVHATAQPKVIDILKKGRNLSVIFVWKIVFLELNPSNLTVNADARPWLLSWGLTTI